MKVSVVTISFNQGQYLTRNRASVAGQADEIEHVIVDPGSGDNSRDLIAQWAAEDPLVRPIFESDRGPADGLNRGLRASTGEIWLYLNADDELAPGSVAEIVEAHRRRPDVDVLIGDGWTVDPVGRPIRHIRSDRFSPRRYALGVGTVLQQATSFKAARTRGSIDFNIQNRYNWDTEYLFNAYRAGLKFGYEHADYGYFRMQPESITVSGRFAKGLADERGRLISGVAGHRVLRALSPAARAAKSLNRLKPAMPFPGLVGDV